MEYYSTLLKKELSSCERTQRNFNCKEPIWKGYILYDSNSPTFWERQKCGDSKKTSSGQGLGTVRDRVQRIFKAVKIVFMMLYRRVSVIIHWFKPIGYTKPRLNLNVNYGLWVMTMCLCRFNSCLQQMYHSAGISTNRWEVAKPIGRQTYMGTLRTFLSFCCAPKTALKKEKIKSFLKHTPRWPRNFSGVPEPLSCIHSWAGVSWESSTMEMQWGAKPSLVPALMLLTHKREE